MLLREFPFKSIAFHNEALPAGPFRHVIFDFDGTISLIRGGWADVMAGCFLEWMAPGPEESAAELGEKLRQEVLALNGKQTIFQMAHFAGRLRERGVVPREPEWYKARFTEALLRKTAERLAAIREGRKPSEEYLVAHVLEVLRLLRAGGAQLYLISGTERRFVLEEAEALGVDEFFANRIYGPEGDDQSFSKMKIMSEIMERQRVPPGELLSFGDGPVEIQNTKLLGGLAVGIASDELLPGSGRMDECKRRLLLEGGADLIAPDYLEIPAVLDWLREGKPGC